MLIKCPSVARYYIVKTNQSYYNYMVDRLHTLLPAEVSIVFSYTLWQHQDSLDSVWNVFESFYYIFLFSFCALTNEIFYNVLL